MRKHLMPLLLALLPTTAIACAPVEEEAADDGAAAMTDKALGNIGQRISNPTGGEVYSRNEDALSAKLGVVERAQKGDTLDVSYYIFSDDESSALYATRLVEAARRGVKVRVMLDYLTNFTRYHYFKAMQDAAGGADKMEFRFYNKPSANIVTDIKYLVTPCSLPDKPIMDPACTADRQAKSSSAESAAKADIFLSGLYSKNAGAMQVAMGEVIQQYQAAATAGGPTKPEDRAKAIEAFKLVFDAKFKGDVSAAILVFLAGDKLAPINNAFAALIPAAAGDHKRDWQHLSDFTHQKLTLRTSPGGKAEMVTGGRNVENSYHLTELPKEREGAWRKKYVFMDMDSHVAFDNGDAIQGRFEKLWNFDGMVAKMNGDVEKLTPVGLEIPVLGADGKPTGQMVPVLKAYTYKEIEATAKRFLDEYADYDTKTGAFTKIKASGKALALADEQFPKFDLSQDPGASLRYVDNVPNPKGQRVYGTDIAFGAEAANGKEIQELWFRALEDACKKGDAAKPQKKVEVIFHNAYLSLPSRLQHQLFDRTNLYGNGTRFECENGVTQVKILTNSRESTDLNIVNVYNEPWMKPTMQADRLHADGKRFIEYREYQSNQITQRNPIQRSLHAKVMIFGNAIWIGSANADGRSQFMDSNNGVFINNAPNLVAQYKKWLSTTVEQDFLNPKEDPRGLRSGSIEGGPEAPEVQALAKDNAEFMSAGLRARGQSDTVVNAVYKRILEDTKSIYKTSSTALPNMDKAALENLDQILQVN